MSDLDKKSLSETDIRTKLIIPAIQSAGWGLIAQVCDEVFFTNGWIIWKGKTVKRGQRRLADYTAISRTAPLVATVDQLMAICDELESELTLSQTDSERLLKARVLSGEL